MIRRLLFASFALTLISAPDAPVVAQGAQGAPALVDGYLPAPARRANEGLGPYQSLVIHGVMVIDGTGGPPYGPVDIVIAGNRIQAIRSAGTPGLPMRPAPTNAEKVIDATGMYVMPGFIDMHVHGGGEPKNASLEYAYKLWLAHGVTTVRGVPMASHRVTVSERERSAKNEIVAPRIVNYQRPGSGWPNGSVDTAAKARAWVQWGKQNGLDGLKVGAEDPAIMQALMSEAKAQGMGTTAHLQQGGVAQMNAITAARLGLQTVTHFYGHFESLLKDYVVQPWPIDMNANDEQWRFGQVARLWDKIYPPGSPEWKAYLAEHLKLGTVFDPTLTIYSAGRDVMRFRAAEWHDKYTLPSLMDFYAPSRASHGAYWYYWTTEDEVQWRNFYQRWFQLVNDYKKMGGRVTTGSDSGFIYQTYGFGYINEFEMLQEAGFHPLEVIQAATYNGALTLAEAKLGLDTEARKLAPIDRGAIKPGLLADLVIVDENPLENFKVLYGTGAVKLNDKTTQVEHVGGIKYTVKDGIVYDAKQLLADVAKMVDDQKKLRTAKK
ncbi:MAG: amidohydrolase [Acidobacteria bacterium]|nr:MAG: amidohydrolase [Acidobacteriota bacterium]